MTAALHDRMLRAIAEAQERPGTPLHWQVGREGEAALPELWRDMHLLYHRTCADPRYQTAFGLPILFTHGKGGVSLYVFNPAMPEIIAV